MCETKCRTFAAESFRTPREWIYFCVEYDLEICAGCHQRARRRESADPGGWSCGACVPQYHPALIEALALRENVATECDLCQASISIRDGWISEDCQRIYCASHLKPLTKEDRFKLTRRYLRARLQPESSAGRGPESCLTSPMNRLTEHYDRVDCESCEFNAMGIYDGERLVEIDRGGRSCDCAPDTLNCANMHV